MIQASPSRRFHSLVTDNGSGIAIHFSPGQLTIPGTFSGTPGNDSAFLARIAELGECKPGAVGGHFAILQEEPATIEESIRESWRKTHNVLLTLLKFLDSAMPDLYSL